MTILWLGLLLLSSSWLFIIPVFIQQSDWIPGTGAALLGILFISLASYSANYKISKSLFKSCLDSCINGVWIALLVFCCQFILLPVLYFFAAAYHRIDFISPFIWSFFRLVGFESTIDHGIVFLQNEEYLVPFSTNWEKLGLFIWIQLLVSCLILITITSSNIKYFIKHAFFVILIFLIYLVFRYSLMVIFYIGFSDVRGNISPADITIFWNPFIIILSYLPLALFLNRIIVVDKIKFIDRLHKVFYQKKVLFYAFSMVFLAVFFLFSTFTYYPLGKLKQGRVLFDDYHSKDWEVSTRRLDENGFGSHYLYNYYSLVSWLRNYYLIEVNQDRPLSGDLLKNYDAVVIKTPTIRYDKAEIDAVEKFVRQGGGLLLIGDHTNLLGMTTFINQIASMFGIKFNYDASNSLSTSYFSNFSKPLLFGHPVVSRLPAFHFLTSCTLSVSPAVESVMIGRDLISDRIDYSKPSFFGDMIPNTDDNFGLFFLSAATRYKQGRVLAFTDSTVFSNFSIFLDGHAEFFLHALNYVNHKNGLINYVNYCFFLLFLFFSIKVYHFWTHLNRVAILTTLAIGGALGVVSAGLAVNIINYYLYTEPVIIRNYDRIAFLKTNYTNFFLPPVLGPYIFPVEKSFDALYVIPQRYSWVPFVATTLEQATLDSKGIVLINPLNKAPASAIKSIADYIINGGRLLIIKADLEGDKFLSELKHYLPADSKEKSTYFEIAEPVQGDLLEKLSSKLKSNISTILVTVTEAGQGRLIVAANSEFFSRDQMGHVQDKPNPKQQSIYNIAFKIFKDLLNIEILSFQATQ